MEDLTMETEKNVGKYENRYGIFTEQVDIQVLHDIILNDLMQHLDRKNSWFAVWKVLKDNDCLVKFHTRSDFGRQIMDWYKDVYGPNCIDTYASTSLSLIRWEEWNKDSFAYFQKRDKKAIEKRRVSVRTVEKLYYLCKQIDPIIKKCIKKNIQN